MPGVSGTWKDLTDNVNFMASNLTSQVRNIALVTTAVANGDLSKKITVDVKGEILELKNTINTMVDQLNSFAAEVTRVAREVGTEGKLGGQAEVRGVAGTWKDLTDNVNFMARNLTTQVRGIVKVVTAVANGDLKQKLVVEAKGEVAALAETINSMTDTLGTFAEQVSTVAREVGVGGQAGRPGARARRRRHVEGPHRQRELHGLEPDHPGARHRQGRDRGRQRRPLAEALVVDAKGEVAALADTINSMTDTLGTFAEQVSTVAREVGIEGKLGGQAKVPGAHGHLAAADRQREPARRQPHLSGARHLRRRHRGDQGRSHAVDRRRSAGRGRGAQGQHQPDDRQPEGDDAEEHRAGLAEDEPRQVLRHDAGPEEPRGRVAAHHVAADAARSPRTTARSS